MKGKTDRRSLVFRIALAMFACGGVLFFSPLLVRSTLAADGEVTCTATCTNGSCTGNKPYCICSCTWWTSSAVCNCTQAPEQEEKPVSPAGA